MSWIAFIRVALCCLRVTAIGASATIALPLPALAQHNPIVGLWSTTIDRQGGEAYAAFWIEFGPSGEFRERVTTSNSEMFYSGAYELSGDGSLAYRLDDYAPKQKCTGTVCLPWQPSLPIGQVMYAHIDLIDARTFLFSEGNEQFEFHRQR
jgi:hypothetical protein